MQYEMIFNSSKPDITTTRNLKDVKTISIMIAEQLAYASITIRLTALQNSQVST